MANDLQPRLTPAEPRTPAYVHEVYHWAYVDPRRVRWLERNWVVRLILFGNDRRLMAAYLNRIRPGMRVWQVAHVYGDLIRNAALRCGAGGSFELSDVTPIQLQLARRKLAGLPWAKVTAGDATSHSPCETPQLISCFFLLHEVPDAVKSRIVDNLLGQLPDSAELLFVDYHRPRWWQPARLILMAVNRWLEPFAASLWKREIASFASQPEHYQWRKHTLFGGVYQVVSVTRRSGSGA